MCGETLQKENCSYMKNEVCGLSLVIGSLLLSVI